MAAVWVLADLHLSFGDPSKTMDVFGPAWQNHAARLAEKWKEKITAEDLVLLPGDISWAMHLSNALVDLNWIAALPGTKVMIKGNHDYWWGSLNQLRKALPESIHAVQNDSFSWKGISIAGARLWDTPEYSFSSYIDFQKRALPAGKEAPAEQTPEFMETVYLRELGRLELSLKALDPKAHCKIAMTHYPPIGPDLAPSRASALLEKYGVQYCLFGHLHNVRPGSLPLGVARGVDYRLTACDYLGCDPLFLLQL